MVVVRVQVLHASQIDGELVPKNVHGLFDVAPASWLSTVSIDDDRSTSQKTSTVNTILVEKNGWTVPLYSKRQ